MSKGQTLGQYFELLYTDLLNYSTSPNPLPCSKFKTEGAFCSVTSCPSLPCSKRKTEGAWRFLLQPPYSLPAQNARQRKRVLLQPPAPFPSLPCLKHKMEGGHFFFHPPTPSLAQNTRWMGPTALVPPLLKTQDGRAVLLKPPPYSLRLAQNARRSFFANHPYSLPCSKRKTEGDASPTTTPFPLGRMISIPPSQTLPPPIM